MLIDRQGDPATELAVAELIANGEMHRHTRKAMKLYAERRLHFAEILSDRFRSILEFDLPEAFLPEFPPAMYLQTRPELGDVSRGEVVSIPWPGCYSLEGYFLPAPGAQRQAPAVICFSEPGHRKEAQLQGLNSVKV